MRACICICMLNTASHTLCAHTCTSHVSRATLHRHLSKRTNVRCRQTWHEWAGAAAPPRRRRRPIGPIPMRCPRGRSP
eukprot:276596-Chlamydomonas_euryale.AAC.1